MRRTRRRYTVRVGSATHRIGIISDIHGSIVALELGCQFLEHQGVDLVVCGGDIASFGPEPNETVEFLRDAGIPAARGNEDEAMCRTSAVSRKAENETQRQLDSVNAWSREQLTEINRDWLRALPDDVRIEPGFLCTHAAPGNTTKIVVPESAKPFPDGVSCICAGHIHQPFVWTDGTRTWANAGSVARPMDGDPRGSLAIAELREGRWSARTFRFELPVDEMCRRIRKAHMPYASRLCETQIEACWW